MKHLWLFFKFAIWRPVSKYYVHDCLKKQFFALVSIKIFKIYFFALFQVENFLWQIFRQSWSKYLRHLSRKRQTGEAPIWFVLQNSRITSPIETKLYRRVASDKSCKYCLKGNNIFSTFAKKALKMCWRHQNFQMPTTTHQTTVPSTHPKIQSPKSTGQSTWSSHLRASHLRALFYTLLSHKWKWNTCGYF